MGGDRIHKTFQVPVTYEARGYVTVEAVSAEAAKRIVRAMDVVINYNDGLEVNTDMMPNIPDLVITGEPVEDDS